MDVRNRVTNSDQLLNIIAILLISINFRFQQRSTSDTRLVTKCLKTNIKIQFCNFAADSMSKFNFKMLNIVTFDFNFRHLVAATLAESVIK